MNETKKVAMISGANRGIGLAVARALLERGCRLSLGVRQPQSVHADISRCEDVLLCRYEARDRQAARSWVAETVGCRVASTSSLITPASRHSLASRTERTPRSTIYSRWYAQSAVPGH